jgi:hypothetical protein
MASSSTPATTSWIVRPSSRPPPPGTSARESGATWAQIGEALGITKHAAHDFYRRKIEEQEKYLSNLHEAAAARAVLED